MLSKNISSDNTSSEAYSVLALSSSEADYRLAWLINKALLINLQRYQPVSLYKEGVSFTTFMDDKKNDVRYILLSNKNKEEGSILFTEFPTIDFFLKVGASSGVAQVIDVRKKIKSISEISACIPLTLKKKATGHFFDNL